MTVKELYESLSDIGEEVEGSKIVAGLQSEDDYVRSSVVDSINTITSDVDAVATGIPDLTDARLKLAKDAAVAGLDPVGVFKLGKNSNKYTDVYGLQSAGQEAINIGNSPYDLSDDDVAGLQSFDGVTLKTTPKFAVVLNSFSAIQEPGLEALFKTIPVDPKSAGFTFTTTMVYLTNEFKRNFTGKPSDNEFKLEPLSKILNNPDKLNVDSNKLLPVYRTESAEYLVEETGLKHTVEYQGGTVDTAPYRVGKKIGILEISQSDVFLAEGQLTDKASLDNGIKLENIYFKVTGKDSDGNDVTEYFKQELNNMMGAFIKASFDGDSKDLTLNLSSDIVNFNTSTVKRATDNMASEIFGAIGGNYTITVRPVISGTGNLTTGSFAVYFNAVDNVEIRDGNGNLVVNGDDYDKIMEVLKTFEVVGYDLDARMTNTTARLKGQKFTVRTRQYYVTVNYRTGHTIDLPIVDNGPESDLHLLDGNINLSQFKRNAEGYKTLINFINYMAQSDGKNVKLNTPADEFINSGMVNGVINLVDIVDSLSSNDRLDDIKTALMNKIILEAAQLYRTTNLGPALKMIKDNNIAGVKPTLTIIADNILATVLDLGGSDSGFEHPDFNIKVYSTINEIMKGKIVYAFTFDGVQGGKIHPLTFGVCLTGPDLPIVATRDKNGEVYKESTVMHRFRHMVLTPIVGNYTVTGLAEVLGKLNIAFTK